MYDLPAILKLMVDYFTNSGTINIYKNHQVDRKPPMKRAIIILFTVACAFSAAFPGEPISPSRKEILKIGIPYFPGSLNPLYATDEISQSIVNKIFDPLFYFDGSGEPRSRLVDSCKFIETEKKVVIMLKKNIFFSNGEEMDADDVLATLTVFKDPRFKSPYSFKLKFIETVKKTGKYSLEMKINTSIVTWQKLLSIKILNAGELFDCSPQSIKERYLCGTGAYRIFRVEEPSTVILRLSDLEKTPSLFRTIEYQVVAYTQLAPLKLLNNEIDICELQPINKEAYVKVDEWQEKFELVKYKKFGFTYLVFNLQNPKITRNIRYIIYNHLIHGNFLDRFLKGRGERVKTPFLLLEPKIADGTLPVHPLENPVELNILCNSESKIRKEFILFLVKELNPFNIRLFPTFIEYHTFLSYIRKSRFDLAVSGFIADIDYDMKDILYSGSYFNYAHFKHTGMDRLLDLGLQEFDPVKREALYLDAHRLWRQELPLIPLFNLYYYVGISRRIKIPEHLENLIDSESDFLFDIRRWKMD
jgi:peptide/nickel transport system substrate-binding protein